MSEQPFVTLQWNGFPLYQCTFCPHNSTNEDVAATHFLERHLLRPETSELPPQSSILVADKYGNPVEPATDMVVDELSETDLLALTAAKPKRRRR